LLPNFHFEIPVIPADSEGAALAELSYTIVDDVSIGNHAALATLTKRGLSAAERARLRALVSTATTAAKINEGASDAAEEAPSNEAVLKLYAWYGEWSEVARAVIKRRDHLIRLGLAKRKKAAKAEGEGEGGPKE
jgi:hypothetical protein